jgi:N-acylglucosamine 2-epimerase
MTVPTAPGLDRIALAAVYRDALLDDVVPFWLRYGLDREQGGS